MLFLHINDLIDKFNSVRADGSISALMNNLIATDLLTAIITFGECFAVHEIIFSETSSEQVMQIRGTEFRRHVSIFLQA